MDYKFKKGITAKQIDQLVQYSKTDPTIQKFTSDPVRFKDKKSAKQWLAGVIPYTLSDQGGNLLGLTWFHKKLLPERKYTEKLDSTRFPLTFAIRIYGEARGKGYATEFMKKSFEDFKPGNVWAETSFDNFPTIKLSEKFGFRKVTEPDERGKIIMILGPSIKLRTSKPE